MELVQIPNPINSKPRHAQHGRDSSPLNTSGKEEKHDGKTIHDIRDLHHEQVSLACGIRFN